MFTPDPCWFVNIFTVWRILGRKENLTKAIEVPAVILDRHSKQNLRRIHATVSLKHLFTRYKNVIMLKTLQIKTHTYKYMFFE